MNSRDLMREIALIIGETQLEAHQAENGSIFIGGSRENATAFVSVSAFDGTDGLVFARLVSPVLQELELEGERRTRALNIVNQLNVESKMGRWFVLDHEDGRSSIFLQHEILGNKMNKFQLLNAIGRIVGTADYYDEWLDEQVGPGIFGLRTGNQDGR